MKNSPDSRARGIPPAFDRQIAIAELLLRNTQDLRAAGLKQHHYDLLLLLKTLEPAEPRTLIALSRRLHADPSYGSASLAELRRRHLVSFKRSSANLPLTISLTKRGEALLARLFRKDYERWLRMGPSLLSTLCSMTQEDGHDPHDSLC
jgi:DNA-binding MarR family transcriptional regulator